MTVERSLVTNKCSPTAINQSSKYVAKISTLKITELSKMIPFLKLEQERSLIIYTYILNNIVYINA